MRERFHTMTLLFVVVIRNMKAVNWNIDHLFVMMPNLVSYLFLDSMSVTMVG